MRPDTLLQGDVFGYALHEELGPVAEVVVRHPVLPDVRTLRIGTDLESAGGTLSALVPEILRG